MDTPFPFSKSMETPDQVLFQLLHLLLFHQTSKHKITTASSKAISQPLEMRPRRTQRFLSCVDEPVCVAPRMLVRSRSESEFSNSPFSSSTETVTGTPKLSKSPSGLPVAAARLGLSLDSPAHPVCDACPQCDDVCEFRDCPRCAAKIVLAGSCGRRPNFTMCQVRRHNKYDPL